MVTVILTRNHSINSLSRLTFPTGLLELPNVPPTIKYLSYKLFLSGKSGSGKTSLVSYLSGRPNWTAAPNHQVETPGIRVSKVYWPAKVQNQLVLFALDLWDSGDASSRKYGHIQPVSNCDLYFLAFYGTLLHYFHNHCTRKRGQSCPSVLEETNQKIAVIVAQGKPLLFFVSLS